MTNFIKKIYFYHIACQNIQDDNHIRQLAPDKLTFQVYNCILLSNPIPKIQDHNTDHTYHLLSLKQLNIVCFTKCLDLAQYIDKHSE